jgi:hypothetical protein
VLQVERPTVIEGNIVDNELGTPVGGASIAGKVRSNVIHVNVQADENGRFRVVLPRTLAEGNHTFMFNVSAPGYDNRRVTGTLRRGDTRHVEIRLNYNPFDVEILPDSDNMVQDFLPFTTYAGSSGWQFHRWQHIEDLALDDPRVPIFRDDSNFKLESITSLVRVRDGYWKYTPVYGWGPWNHLSTTTREVTQSEWNNTQVGTTYITFPQPKTQIRTTTTKWTDHVYTTYYVYDYRYYNRNWHGLWWGPWFLVDTGTWGTPEWRGKTFTRGGGWFDGWKRVYTFNRTEAVHTDTNYMVQFVTHRRLWIRTGTTRVWIPPVYENQKTGYSLSGRVDRNTHFYRTDFAPLPWESRHATVTVTPRNNYTDVARLEVENNASVRAELGQRELRLGSPAQTTLTLRPYEHAGGSHTITVRAYDDNGRLVEVDNLNLCLTSNRPVGFATHHTVYRNAWDPVTPPPPPPPPHPSANIVAGAHTVGNIIVERRWHVGSWTVISVNPATFTVNMNGSGSWAHGNTVGNGTVSFSCFCRHRGIPCGRYRNPCADINRTPSITISNGGNFSTSILINAAYLPVAPASDQQGGSGFVGALIYVTLHAPNGANATATTAFSVYVREIVG